MWKVKDGEWVFLECVFFLNWEFLFIYLKEKIKNNKNGSLISKQWNLALDINTLVVWKERKTIKNCWRAATWAWGPATGRPNGLLRIDNPIAWPCGPHQIGLPIWERCIPFFTWFCLLVSQLAYRCKCSKKTSFWT